MFSFQFIFILFPSIIALNCPQLYDHSTDTITCVSTCPSKSLKHNNKCLLANQYLINSQVHLCENGFVSIDRSLCCKHNTYLISINNISACGKCNGKIYQNGRLCCPSSTYVYFSDNEQANCRKIGTGSCSEIKINQQFKVCCSSNEYYHIQFKKCVRPINYNCQSFQKICCSQGKRLQFVNNQYICVLKCNWGNKDRFFCKKRFCNQNNLILSARRYQTIITDPHFLAFQNQCCYSHFINGSCVNSAIQCGKKFTNRGWSICCPNGQLYSVSKRICTTNCEGYILLQRLCINNGFILNLQNQIGVPTQMASNLLCNNRKLPQSLPVCCLQGFYMDKEEGCKLCNGRIFNINVKQVCCSKNQIFNQKTQKCEFCNGNIDQQGILCCFEHQYIKYSSSGIALCQENCILDQIYKTQFCCESLTNNNCLITDYKQTLCNPSYFKGQSCQVCPRLCSIPTHRNDYCTRSDIGNCNAICSSATVFYQSIGQCLPCDQSCQQCIRPFDSQFCSSCASGYIKNLQICEKCAFQCETCITNVNTCSSCSVDSFKPVLSSGKCIANCEQTKYFNLLSNNCKNCSFRCLQCVGQAQSQCSKCKQNHYLSSIGQGSCLPCSQSCLTCYKSNNKCVTCKNFLYSLHQQNWTCMNSCNVSSTKIFTITNQHSICRLCHPKCQRCSQLVQNCVQCKSQFQYLQDTLGISLCTPCILPCQKCFSTISCSSCVAGYYLAQTSCIKCHQTCKTCFGGSSINCFSCYGQSQLILGKCVGCSNSCARCNSQQKCLQCKASFLLYKGNCVTRCPDSTYPVQIQCFDCLNNCSICSNSTKCLICSSTHQFKLNDLCLTQCPNGYENINRVCTQIKPVNPIDPVDPIDPIDPVDPTDPVDPVKPVDPVDPVDPIQPTSPPKIINQIFSIKRDENDTLLIQTQFQRKIDVQKHQLDFFLINKKTGKEIDLQKKLKVTNFQNQNQIEQIEYEVQIPQAISLKDYLVKTQIENVNSQPFITSKGFFQFLLYDYQTDPLARLKYIGLFFAILILIYIILTKLKGHFLAQESNTLILHMLNFCQVVYLFKFTHVHNQGMYHFLNGFSFIHLSMFPNFFQTTIPENYQQYPAQQSLIPDSNFIKNAGGSISLLLLAIIIICIAIVISYALFKQFQMQQMPQIRKILRIGILIIHLTFMNILFVSLTHLIQPHISQPSDIPFVKANQIFSIIFSIIIPIAMIGIIYHYYKTYNSDVLQHFYTIREGYHYLLIFNQAILFTFAVGKPLICLCLIPLQIGWLVFNYLLYYYGQGYTLKQYLKFIVIVGCIIFAYIMLSVSQSVNWIVIVVFVSIIIIILITYSSYQIIGLYYYIMFPKQKSKNLNNQIQKNK